MSSSSGSQKLPKFQKTKLTSLKDSLLQSLEEKGGLRLKIKLSICFCCKTEVAPIVGLPSPN